MNFVDILQQNLSSENSVFSANEKKLLHLVLGNDNKPVRDKSRFYMEKIQPLINEMASSTPLSTPTAQYEELPGTWLSVWTTIPFLDMIPGRVHETSYQIFSEQHNYYANVARYFPTSKNRVLKSLFEPAYDLMILQRYGLYEDEWQIQNVGIKQKVHYRKPAPMSLEQASSWFDQILDTDFSAPQTDQEVFLDAPEANKFNSDWAKKLGKTYKAKPYFHHLYMSPVLRCVETRREAKQKPSFTIAVRIDNL